MSSRIMLPQTAFFAISSAGFRNCDRMMESLTEQPQLSGKLASRPNRFELANMQLSVCVILCPSTRVLGTGKSKVGKRRCHQEYPV